MEETHPTPPPNSKLPSRKLKWLIPLIIGVVIVSVIAGLLNPMVIRSRKKSPQSQTSSNAHQIGLALFEFENEYGTSPNASTAAFISQENPSYAHDLSGTSSNALLRQLIAAGIIQSESMFYIEMDHARKPDNIITPGKALQKGEVCFAYISNHTTAGHPARPLLLGPVTPGTTNFDPKPFDGNAIVIRIDQSVTSYKIKEDGHIYDNKGLNLLSPTHPIWNGTPPTIHYPE